MEAFDCINASIAAEFNEGLHRNTVIHRMGKRSNSTGFMHGFDSVLNRGFVANDGKWATIAQPKVKCLLLGLCIPLCDQLSSQMRTSDRTISPCHDCIDINLEAVFVGKRHHAFHAWPSTLAKRLKPCFERGSLGIGYRAEWEISKQVP